MALATAIEDGTLSAAFETVADEVRAERDRTATERDAFAEFADAVRRLDPSEATPATRSDTAGGGALALASRGAPAGSATRAPEEIRAAYERTVMAVPFYEAEYGDTYEESVRAEFGPDVATALTESRCFGPTVKEALLAGVDRARQERTQFIESCDRELDSVGAAEESLASVAAEWTPFRSVRFEDQRFGNLKRYRERLLSLESACESVAATRQDVIDRQRRDHRLSVDAPDLSAYLYEPLAPTYPVLYLCSDLAGALIETRTRVESAMASG